jgi:hypothetical protein
VAIEPLAQNPETKIATLMISEASPLLLFMIVLSIERGEWFHYSTTPAPAFIALELCAFLALPPFEFAQPVALALAFMVSPVAAIFAPVCAGRNRFRSESAERAQGE